MIPTDRFERHLHDDLANLAGERTPPYVSDLLARTARQRQRPAWTFLERWLPVTITLRRPMLVPPLRLVLVAVVLLVGALLALPSLTRPTMMPAGVSLTPANGIIAFQPDEGHIHRLDPTTGRGSLWLLDRPVIIEPRMVA